MEIPLFQGNLGWWNIMIFARFKQLDAHFRKRSTCQWFLDFFHLGLLITWGLLHFPNQKLSPPAFFDVLRRFPDVDLEELSCQQPLGSNWGSNLFSESDAVDGRKSYINWYGSLSHYLEVLYMSGGAGFLTSTVFEKQFNISWDDVKPWTWEPWRAR